MIRSKKLGVVLGVALALGLGTFAEVHAQGTAKVKDIRKLLEVSGAGKLGAQVMAQMLPRLKSLAPNAPEQFWQDFLKEAKPDGIVELIVPIYDRHFDHADIKNIIKFYESPIGKKLIAKMPAITQESMVAGQKWGEVLAKGVLERLQKKP